MSFYPEIRSDFEDYLNSVAFNQQYSSLYQPVKYVLSMRGKRIRPLLLIKTYQLYQDQYRDIFPQAFAIELFHNFTLVHDDIMDAADLRRGQMTVHQKYDINRAILAGDVMMMWAYHYLQLGLKPVVASKVINHFNHTAIAICEGQQLDIDFENKWEIRVEQYIKMIELKTAVLIGSALAIGAIAGGADQESAGKLFEAGRLLGISFQIQDDFLDLYGNAGKFGKIEGGDILQKKKSFLYTKTCELLDDSQKEDFMHLYDSDHLAPVKKIEAVKKYFDQVDVAEIAKNAKNQYFQQGKIILQSVEANSQKMQVLVLLFEKIFQRNY